jgi:hypothetical protein
VLGFGMRLHPRKKKHKQCISKVQVKHKQGTSESTSKTFFFFGAPKKQSGAPKRQRSETKKNTSKAAGDLMLE